MLLKGLLTAGGVGPAAARAGSAGTGGPEEGFYPSYTLDGVFSEEATGGLRFHPAPPPSDDEVVRLLATIRSRVLRLLRRRGLVGDEDPTPPDPR